VFDIQVRIFINSVKRTVII